MKPDVRKIILISAGTVTLFLCSIGIVIPGLPTTPFLLISVACYIRSSKKLYDWLMNHKILGHFIREYHVHKAITKRTKISALIITWITLSISVVLFIPSLMLRLIVIGAGCVGSIIIILIPTIK